MDTIVQLFERLQWWQRPLVGIYELLYGAGICLFRTGMPGVLLGGYAFGAFCLYGLLHWTMGWF